MTTLRLGTRGSKLAVTQAMWVADRLSARHGIEVTLVTISTDGDESGLPIDRLGTTGVFVTAVRNALAGHEIDLAVHSYKDLPAAAVPGLRVAAVPVREDARDALFWRGGLGQLGDLAPGARVGTGSPRRAAQLLAHRPDLVPVPLRGNVDTRLRRVAEGTVDAVVLAMAGLARLGRLAGATAIPVDVLLPAPAQGALAVECRAADNIVAELLAALDDPASRQAVTAERAFLARLGAGCTTPVAAHATVASSQLVLAGLVATPDGRRMRAGRVGGPNTAAAELGRQLAASLLEQGAGPILESDPATTGAGR